MGTDRTSNQNSSFTELWTRPRKVIKREDGTQTGTAVLERTQISEPRPNIFISLHPLLSTAAVGGKRLPFSYLLGFDFYLDNAVKRSCFCNLRLRKSIWLSNKRQSFFNSMANLFRPNPSPGNQRSLEVKGQLGISFWAISFLWTGQVLKVFLPTLAKELFKLFKSLKILLPLLSATKFRHTIITKRVKMGFLPFANSSVQKQLFLLWIQWNVGNKKSQLDVSGVSLAPLQKSESIKEEIQLPKYL